MDRDIWVSALVGFLAPVVLFSPLNGAKAWVTSFLNSRKPAVAAPSTVAHPVVTVRRSARVVVARRRGAKAPVQLAQAPVAKPLDPQTQLAQTIDPNKRPDWYLIDPTLKKGDVLFLRNRVLVFRGGRIGDLRDYVPVSGTRLLSRKERRIIEGLAAHSPAPSDLSRPAPQGAATAKTGRSQVGS